MSCSNDFFAFTRIRNHRTLALKSWGKEKQKNLTQQAETRKNHFGPIYKKKYLFVLWKSFFETCFCVSLHLLRMRSNSTCGWSLYNKDRALKSFFMQQRLLTFHSNSIELVTLRSYLNGWTNSFCNSHGCLITFSVKPIISMMQWCKKSKLNARKCRAAFHIRENNFVCFRRSLTARRQKSIADLSQFKPYRDIGSSNRTNTNCCKWSYTSLMQFSACSCSNRNRVTNCLCAIRNELLNGWCRGVDSSFVF